MSENTDVKLKKSLENALNFRAKRDKLKQSIIDKDNEISNLKNKIKDKKAEQTKARKSLKKFQDEEKLIKDIAGIPSPENERKSRPYYATKAFFDLINLFNQKGQNDFSQLYNSLQDTKTLARMVLDSSAHGFWDEDGPRDYVIIEGEKLREKIKTELDNRITRIEDAEKLLDAEYQKKIKIDDSKKDEKTSDSSSVVDNESEYE